MDVCTQTGNGAIYNTINIKDCGNVQIGELNKQDLKSCFNTTKKWNDDVINDDVEYDVSIEGDDGDDVEYDVSDNKSGDDRLSKLNEREKELLEGLETCLKKMGLIKEELDKVRLERNDVLDQKKLTDKGDENMREMNTTWTGTDVRQIEKEYNEVEKPGDRDDQTEVKINNDLQEKNENSDYKGCDREVVEERTLESSHQKGMDSTRQYEADRQLDDVNTRQKDADRQKEDDADRQLDSDNRLKEEEKDQRQKDEKADRQGKEKDSDRQEKKEQDDRQKEKDVNRQEKEKENADRPEDKNVNRLEEANRQKEKGVMEDSDRQEGTNRQKEKETDRQGETKDKNVDRQMRKDVNKKNIHRPI